MQKKKAYNIWNSIKKRLEKQSQKSAQVQKQET